MRMFQRAVAVTGLTVLGVTVAASAASANDGTARLLGGLGLAAGVIGVAAGGYGLVRSRS
jgi:hypothetical protein